MLFSTENSIFIFGQFRVLIGSWVILTVCSDASALFTLPTASIRLEAVVEYDRVYQRTENMGQTIAAAQYRLALRYLEGDGVAQNHDKAMNCLRKAAEQGHMEARQHLENMSRKVG